MTPAEYQSALTTLSLTPDQASIWLGIGRSTAYRYLKTGCEGAVERALTERIERERIAVILDKVELWNPYGFGARDMPAGWYVRHSDITAAVGLPGC